MKNTLLLFIAIFLMVACKQAYTPKPRGYFRISFPAKKYGKVDISDLYRLWIPEYATIDNDKDERGWLNVDFGKFNAQINITYKDYNKDFNLLSEEARKWVYNHTVKADAIEEVPFVNRSFKTYGMLYKIEGSTASTIQFYLTDSVSRFIRGALYLKIRPNKDSLAPVMDFLEKDVVHLMETLEWKD